MSGPRGVNWREARDFWLALDPPRSYELVAQRFGVSGTRVRFVARRDNWAELAARIDAEAAAQVLRRIVKTREERIATFLRITDEAFDIALEKLTGGELEVRLADLPALGKHAELVLGEATDRMSFAEVQEALTVVLSIASRYVPRKQLPGFIREVRDRLALDEGGGESEAA